MLIKPELINQIKHLGLNSYESKIWIALLSKGVATAGELSDISNVPRSRTYDVLESLEKKGFIIVKIGKPIKYIAVKPEDVLERVKEKTKQDLQLQIDMINKLKDSEMINELTTLHNNKINHINPDELTNAIKGRSTIQNYISSLIRNANKSIRVISTSDAPLKKLSSLKKAFQDKNLKIDIFAQFNDIKYLNELKKKANVKNINLNMRVIIIDDEDILFYLTKENCDSNYETAIHAKSPLFAKTIINLAKNL